MAGEKGPQCLKARLRPLVLGGAAEARPLLCAASRGPSCPSQSVARRALNSRGCSRAGPRAGAERASQLRAGCPAVAAGRASPGCLRLWEGRAQPAEPALHLQPGHLQGWELPKAFPSCCSSRHTLHLHCRPLLRHCLPCRALASRCLLQPLLQLLGVGLSPEVGRAIGLLKQVAAGALQRQDDSPKALLPIAGAAPKASARA